MGRWSDRRAAKRARRSGEYLADYYGRSEHDTTGAASPYQVPTPPESDAVQTRGRSRRSGRRSGGRYGFPGWVSQTGRLDPADAAPASTANTGTAPRSRSTDAPPPTPPRPRRWVLVAGGAGGVIAAIVLMIVLVPSGPDVSNRDQPEFETVWQAEIQDLDPDVAGGPSLAAIDSADTGGNRRQMITTDTTWVIAAEQGDVRALIALDPSDGSQVWRHDLAEVLCSYRTGPQDTLFCLAADTAGGQDWTGYVFDAATGAELESWEAPITGAWAVSLTEAGLAVLAESQPHTYDHLALLDRQDGTEIWAADLSVIDDDRLLRTHDIDGVEQTYVPQIGWSGEGERIMLSSGATLILVEGESGDFAAQGCHPTVHTGEILGCGDIRETTTYDANGERLWTSDRVELAYPSYRGEHVLVNVADQSVHQTDWDSGNIGSAVQNTGRATIATGTGAHPFLIDEEDLLSLAPDGSRVHWTQQVRGMDSITDVWVVDDVAIVAGGSALALDLATGEELWQRSYLGNMYLVDSDLVTIGYSEVSLLQIP